MAPLAPPVSALKRIFIFRIIHFFFKLLQSEVLFNNLSESFFYITFSHGMETSSD